LRQALGGVPTWSDAESIGRGVFGRHVAWALCLVPECWHEVECYLGYDMRLEFLGEAIQVDAPLQNRLWTNVERSTA